MKLEIRFTNCVQSVVCPRSGGNANVPKSPVVIKPVHHPRPLAVTKCVLTCSLPTGRSPTFQALE